MALGVEEDACVLLVEPPEAFKLDFNGFFCLRWAIKDDKTNDFEEDDIARR